MPRAGVGLIGGAADYGTELLLTDVLHQSHGVAGGVGGLVGGASSTAAAAGLSLALAPETLGASLIGGLVTAASATAGASMGAQQDQKENESGRRRLFQGPEKPHSYERQPLRGVVWAVCCMVLYGCMLIQRCMGMYGDVWLYGAGGKA